MFIPVAVTTIVARPYVTREPENTMFFWSPNATFSELITSTVLSTPSLSPVRELSLTLREKFSKILPSATTMSPASKNTISPGTICADGISIFLPSRRTFAVGDDMAFKLSRDFSALKYCTVPSIALRIRTAMITIVLSRFPEKAEISAAAMRIITSRSLNCSKNT